MNIDPSIILATAAFIGALFGSAGTIYINAKIAAKAHQEERRKERTQLVLNAIQALVILISDYEAFIHQEPADQLNTTHAKIIGQAIAEILVVNDEVLTKIATDRLTPNMVREQDNPEEFHLYGDYRTRNRNAMMDALKRLGELVNETLKYKN